MNNIRWKLLGGLLLGGLVAWLALTPPPASRFETLKQQVAAGILASATDPDLKLFQQLVQQALSAAEIQGTVVVNAPPTRGALHFYLTDSRSRHFTRCSTGNAVYDAELDAVFVDKNLFQPQELATIGVGSFLSLFMGKRQFAFPRTFVSLILLHELAHRSLHCSNGAFFDGTNGAASRKKELEADDFALAAFRRGFARGIYGKDEGVASEIAEAGLGTHLSADDALTATLLYATDQMNTGLLFSRGAISSLYEDSSHPSYGFRVRRLGDALARQSVASPDLAPFVAFFRARVERVDSFRRVGLLEASADTAIARVCFDAGGLIVVDQDWSIFRISMEQLRPSSVRPGPLVLNYVGRIPISTEGDYLDGMWATTDGSVYMRLHDGRWWLLKNGVIQPDPDATKTVPREAEILPPAGPGDTLVVDDGPGITLFLRDGVSRHLDWPDLMRPIVTSGATTRPTRRDAFNTGDELQMAVHDDHGPLVGSLSVSLIPPFASTFVRLNVSGDIDLTGELALVGSGPNRRYFLVGRNCLECKVTVWQLDPVNPPRVKVEYSPLLDSLGAQPFGGINVPVVVDSVRVVSNRDVLITLPGDSILRYDADANTLEPVFVATGVRLTPSSRGAVAFTTLNAYKAFVLPANHGP